MVNEHLIQVVRKNKFIVHDIKFDYKNSNYQSKAKNSTTKEVLITNYK
jgi:hypothetical protein